MVPLFDFCCLNFLFFNKGDFFHGDNTSEKTAVIIGWALNFIFAIAVQYSFDMSFFTRIEDYLRLTQVITQLIELPEGSDADNNSDSDVGDDPFVMEDGVKVLTLDDSQNLLSWMELRDNVCIEGMKVFGELELFVCCIACWMIGLSGWFCFILLTQENAKDYAGETFLSIAFLYILSIFWILNVLFFGSQFDLLQKRQANAINNQMRTIIFKTTYIDEMECIGPPKWENFAINTWDDIHDLLKEYKEEKKENCFRELVVRKGELESHLRTMKFCLQKVEHYPINPQIFGIGLTGALTKSLIGSVLFPFFSFLFNQYSS